MSESTKLPKMVIPCPYCFGGENNVVDCTTSMVLDTETHVWTCPECEVEYFTNEIIKRLLEGITEIQAIIDGISKWEAYLENE